MTRRIIALAVFILLPLSNALAAPETSCTALIGNCDYYLCEESNAHCGDSGYFLNFGYPFCTRFVKELEPVVEPPQQAWLKRVAACLQEKVDFFPKSLSCGQIEDDAVASHYECYISTGFCETPLGFKLKLFRMIYQTMTNEKMLDTAFRILEHCGEDPLEFERAYSSASDNARQNAQ
ncbi:MAG: hypothetical protein P4M08_04065 [Oligoflexia bacterium]|nr:hypothetical protein [Oligoflexia bacterium]